MDEPVLSSGTSLSSDRLGWTGIIAGALVASAITVVLVAFAAAVGLSTASTAPTWRDASVALWILSGLYMLLVAIVSFGAGGYVAGRVAPADPVPDQAGHFEFLQGIRGLATWALAVLIISFVTLATVRNAEPDTTPVAQPSASKAESLLGYEIDRLFRSDRRPEDMAESRAEAGRILLTSSSHSGVTADDRAYLARLVSARTGLAPADAERRVTAEIDRSREAIAKARHSAVIVAFLTATALLLGAVIAWFASREGALDRSGRLGSPMAALFRHGPLIHGR